MLVHNGTKLLSLLPMAHSTNPLPHFPLLISLPFHTPSLPTSFSKRIPTFPFCNFFKGHWSTTPTANPCMMTPAWEMPKEQEGQHGNHQLLEMGPSRLRFASDQPSLVSGNKRDNMGIINSWKWVPQDCVSHQINPTWFLGWMRNMNVGFVRDSLNENFLVSFLCILRVVDAGAKKWQPKQDTRGDQDGLKGTYRVDVDIPANEWASISDFYDVLVFSGILINFQKKVLSSFYRAGEPILPPLDMSDKFKVVLENMSRCPSSNLVGIILWGQDCMHWCLPGVPDTWVDILSKLIHVGLEIR
ncbi:unnamed protein product [Malus baccata var. baccata]